MSAENLIKSHVVAVTMDAMAKRDAAGFQGIRRGIVNAVGAFLTDELRRSREQLRANKMWVRDEPEQIDDVLRYQYAENGQRHIYEISRKDLAAAIRERVREIEKLLATNAK